MKNLLVVTSYPKEGSIHSNKTVGVASYTKTLLEAVKKQSLGSQIKVLAEDVYKEKKYQENGIEVERIWHRNDIKSLIKLYSEIVKSDYKEVLFSFEIGLFGNPFFALLGVLGILFLRLFGKKTYILLHQVALDFGTLEENPLKAFVLNIISKCFYWLVKLSADKILVFEDVLKKNLGGKSVYVLPHLILESEKVGKIKAQEKLGLEKGKKYGLYFGYIAPYKGVDWLVENWPKNTELIIAGGINPNHKNDSKVKKFVQNVAKAGSDKGIKVTGFVAERDIKLYFSAVDFVVLPYKMFFSSSGPLALAFAYRKPVLLSRTLKDYSKTKDLKTALEKSKLSPKDLIFDFNKESLNLSIKNVLAKKAKFEKFAEFMNTSRSIARISNLFVSLISDN